MRKATYQVFNFLLEEKGCLRVIFKRKFELLTVAIIAGYTEGISSVLVFMVINASQNSYKFSLPKRAFTKPDQVARNKINAVY